MKKSSIIYLLVVVFIFGIGLLEFERGFFWVKEQSDVLNDSEFYLALHQIMPIWIWGVLGMIFSILFIIAPFFLPSQRFNNVFNYLICISGFGNAAFYFLMTSASVFHAINWLTPLQFATLTMINAIAGFFGGADIVGKRR